MAAYDQIEIEAFSAFVPLNKRGSNALFIENSGPVPIAVVSITALDSTHIRVTFNQKLLSNFSLNHKDNYTLSPSVDVLAVTPEAAANPIYVDLTTSEMKQGQAYTLTVEELEAA